ncbi:peptidoglycan editing factor PgeF [Porticoccus sp. W117]|uniref:peptidoglycan editing factor PgeF n=1 Tax=Porticoccus sp. W117 TaxID=3054777 RepID=UPI002595B6F5|nr:peptidoglycan editing factor PgeF [Porticoccus sp. W117]MDM3871249.1 peptidoglycan editing factor PgeF [Porticoccus sp. W117]
MKLIKPDWPLPENVRAAVTARIGGNSSGPWQSANFGLNSGDDIAVVNSNRKALQQQLGLQRSPCWLRQVHGTTIVEAGSDSLEAEADGAISRIPGLAAVVLTADCLPVLLCDRAGTVVAAVHAGWRGLAAGIIRACVADMGVAADNLLVYLGPAISQSQFEVGPEVRQQFAASAMGVEHQQLIEASFTAGDGDRLQADIYQLARAELAMLGVNDVYCGHYCTASQPELFYSYRREGVTGRMASLVWIE